LDKLKEVEGVFRGNQIKSSEEIVPGDEFQFAQTEDQIRASYLTKSGLTSIEVFSGGRFGPSSFSATVTHTVIFLSETGQQLCGYVLDGSKNANTRPSVVLHGKTHSTSNFTLVDISVGCKELDWPAVVAADDHTGTPLSAPNSTWGAA
jgi:hypothetical protein